MKIIKHFIVFNFLICFFTLFFNLSITSPSNATTYCISNETDLLNALADATSNGESDIIRVQQGEYYGNFIYASDEAYGVIIEGGYSEGCISQTINPENTIFDANNNGRVLVLSSPTQTADFTIIGLKLQNGNGGSYYGGGLYINTEGNVSVNKNIINNNLTSGYWGGGINVENANTVTLSSNQINDNNATDGNSDGGGVHISANDTMTILIEKNTIVGNSAGRYGGGVRIWVPNSDNDSVTLINNIISNNSANLGGAGVSIRGGNGIDTIYLINNTIVNNNCTGSEGGGLHLRLGGKNNIAFLYNNIIWNNTTSGGGSDIYINNDEFGDLQLSTANLYYNNFDQSAAGTYIKVPFSMDPSNLNNADPLFVDSVNGDFHLTKDSPCVGSGTSQNAPDTDIDGDSRPLYDTYDIGADEYDVEYDGCPNDPNKTEPGICGCGVSDIDTDLDGTSDCNENCPTDPDKIVPGLCGCGTPDADTDNDGTPDCNDVCLSDPNKAEPGICGCGVSDTDSDVDGVADCNDNCPTDPGKTESGTCGCGVPDVDVDTDIDSTLDCNENCPNDPNKTEPGICGCGVADTDSDGEGMTDCWEEQIIDADANDDITGIDNVLPGDDFDSDGWSNIMEYMRGTDPTDPNSHPSKAMPFILLLLLDN